MNSLNKLLTIAGASGVLFLTTSAEARTRYVFDDPFFDPFLIKQREGLEVNSGINFYEKGDKFYVEAALPGINENDVSLTLDHQILSVKGERKVQEGEENVKRYYTSTNSFNYQLVLPENVDTNNPQATFKNGLMTIVFNKKGETQPKKIEFTYQ